MNDLSKTDEEQLLVLQEAFEKFQERNKKYKDLWKKGGWLDSAHHIRSKSERIVNLLSTGATLEEAELHIEDAVDLINYAAFFIRNVREACQATATD